MSETSGFSSLRGYNLAPDFEGLVVNVSVMIVSKKGQYEQDLTKSFPFTKSVSDTQADIAAFAISTADATIHQAVERDLL